MPMKIKVLVYCRSYPATPKVGDWVFVIDRELYSGMYEGRACKWQLTEGGQYAENNTFFYEITRFGRRRKGSLIRMVCPSGTYKLKPIGRGTIAIRARKAIADAEGRESRRRRPLAGDRPDE